MKFYAKKICITSIFIFTVASLYAQKITNGSFHILANESSVYLSIDYVDSKIAKIPFDIFIEGEDNWDEGYRDITKKLIMSANKKSHGIKYISKKTENYQLVLKVIKVDNDGETRGNLLLLDKDDNVIAVAESFYAEGGRFGSQMNLMSDAAERLGGKIAVFIKKQIKH